jgi:predicted Fe-Mo cluster-binding NifX family protein
MLAVVSINKISRSNNLCEVFGRSQYYLIYNTESKKQEIISNPYLSELGGSGIQSAQFLIGKNIEALITKDIGTNSLRLFKSANIKVYNSLTLTPAEAINYLIKDKLMLFDLINRKSFLKNKEKIKRKSDLKELIKK